MPLSNVHQTKHNCVVHISSKTDGREARHESGRTLFTATKYTLFVTVHFYSWQSKANTLVRMQGWRRQTAVTHRNLTTPHPWCSPSQSDPLRGSTLCHGHSLVTFLCVTKSASQGCIFMCHIKFSSQGCIFMCDIKFAPQGCTSMCDIKFASQPASHLQ